MLNLKILLFDIERIFDLRQAAALNMAELEYGIYVAYEVVNFRFLTKKASCLLKKFSDEYKMW